MYVLESLPILVLTFCKFYPFKCHQQMNEFFQKIIHLFHHSFSTKYMYVFVALQFQILAMDRCTYMLIRHGIRYQQLNKL